MTHRLLAEPMRDESVTVEINTTPLIDVLLVLLIMIIVTVPIPTRLTELGLPAPAVRPAPPSTPVVITLAADGGLSWDGIAVADKGALDQRLDDFVRRADAPDLRLRVAADAPYGAVMVVLSAVRRHEIKSFGLIDVNPATPARDKPDAGEPRSTR